MLNGKRNLYTVIEKAHVSEKSTLLGDKHRQFVFQVSSFATKLDIKKAVEKLFEVKVQTVRTLWVKGKRKGFGRYPGKQKNWKKAYVSLEPGYDINFNPSN